MNAQIGKSTGIALLMAAALLAALFAMGVFGPAGVSGHVGTNDPEANTTVTFDFDRKNLDIDSDMRGREAYEFEIPEGKTDVTFGRISLNRGVGDVFIVHQAEPDDDDDTTIEHGRVNIEIASIGTFSTGTGTPGVGSVGATLLDQFSISSATGELRYNGPKLNFEADDAELEDIADDGDTPELDGKQVVKLVINVMAMGEAPDADTAAEIDDHSDTTIASNGTDLSVTATVDVWVTLTNENDKPTIADSAVVTDSIEENTPGMGEDEDGDAREPVQVAEVTAVDVDTLMTPRADDTDHKDTLEWTLKGAKGADVGHFRINPEADNTDGNRTAIITYVGPGLNYEAYGDNKDGLCGDNDADCTEDITLTVSVSDGMDSTDKMVKIDVIDDGEVEKPAAPAAPVVERKDDDPTGLTITWGQPMNDGPPVTEYRLQVREAGAADWTVTQMDETIEVTSDMPDTPELRTEPFTGRTGTRYEARVNADNSMTGAPADRGDGGESDWSEASMAVAPGGKPAMPTGVTIDAANRQLTVSWTAPTDNGGLDITGYVIYYQQLGLTSELEETAAADATMGTITNLTNGTSYTVRVAAENAAGIGPKSAGKTGIPVGMADQPTSLTIGGVTNTSAFVSWARPATTGGRDITGYQMEYRLDSTSRYTPHPVTDTGTSRDISFPPDTEMDRTLAVRVRAMTGTNTYGSWANARATIRKGDAAPEFRKPSATTFDSTQSDVPGEVVRVELEAMLQKSRGQSIRIKLDKFGLPSSISEDDVTIETDDGVREYEGNPRDVAVSGGNTVTLWLGTLTGAGNTTLNTLDGSKLTVITIQQSAGITHPNVADEYTIQIDGKDTLNRATVLREISVNPASAARGDEITITGKGFSSGDAQVFVDATEDANVGDPVAVSDGSFELVAEVGSAFKAGKNTINATDSAGDRVTDKNGKATGATFTVKPKITVSPDEVAIAQKLTIKLSDWSHGRVTDVRFAGGDRMAVSSADSTFNSGDNTGEVNVIVPDGTRRGKVNVYLFVGTDGTAEGTAVATIATLDLSVSPSSVVPGQSVTINGSDFARLKTDEDITVTIGGKAATVPSDAAVTSTGRVSVTVAVPLDVGTGDKTVALKAGAITGNGEVTVAKPSITVSPEESLPGTIVSVSGSGFASGERLEVLYDGVFEETGRADTNGNFSLRLQIPSDAGIGTTNKVKVQVRNELNINASADHKTPGAMITLPTQAQSGSMITITGSNFAPFSVLSKVTIGTQNAMPSPAPETDRNGQFSFQARVPRLGVGSHNVTVEDSGTPKNTATETFTVSDTPIVSTPAEVFGSLGDKLLVVWRYDNATTSWASYDPNAPAELNDLTGVSRGDIVWVEVTENVMFQGGTLYAGWNLISLE